MIQSKLYSLLCVGCYNDCMKQKVCSISDILTVGVKMRRSVEKHINILKKYIGG